MPYSRADKRDDLDLGSLLKDFENSTPTKIEDGSLAECELTSVNITLVIPIELLQDSEELSHLLNDVFDNLQCMDAACGQKDNRDSELGMVTIFNSNEIELFYAGKIENYTWEQNFVKDAAGHWKPATRNEITD